jgi:hypothetical protein
MRIEVTADKPEDMRRGLAWAAGVCGALPAVTALYVVIVETREDIEGAYSPDWAEWLYDEHGWVTCYDGAVEVGAMAGADMEATLTRFLETY